MWFFIVGTIALLFFIFFCMSSKNQEDKFPEAEIDDEDGAEEECLGITGRDLLTPSELVYFHFIESILPKGYRVFPQVSFNAFVHSDDISVRNRFNRKSCDMILVKGQGLDTIAVIEIDDPKSHNSKRAREKDAKRDAIVAQAGYPTVRMNNNDSESYVRQVIYDVIRKNPL